MGVGIIVIKPGGDGPQVMLHQRKGSLGLNYWGSGGGHLELGESLMDGAPEETTDWQWFALNDLPSPLFPPVERYLEAMASGQVFFDSAFK
jgi:hypothetical protein